MKTPIVLFLAALLTIVKAQELFDDIEAIDEYAVRPMMLEKRRLCTSYSSSACIYSCRDRGHQGGYCSKDTCICRPYSILPGLSGFRTGV